MVIADVVNNNSISATALSFFSVIVAGIVTIMVQSIKSKQSAREAALKADEAAKKAEAARQNTVNVSNGFAGNMDKKLTFIIGEISRLKTIADKTSESVTNHLEWHLEKEQKK